MNGHVIAEVGRHNNGTCRGCQSLYNLKAFRRTRRDVALPRDSEYLSNHAAGLVDLTKIHIQAAPLLWWLDRYLAATNRKVPEKHTKAIWLARRNGYFTVARADELCVDLLRRHPSEVYGDAWFEETA